MTKKRLIAVLIVRNGQVVQSEKFIHTNVIHYDAIHAVEAFSKWDVDEIIILNVSKEKSSRESFAELIEHVSKQCWVPMAAGGFIDDLGYGSELIERGADKLVINTAFLNASEVPAKLSEKFGRQCIIASIDVRTNKQKLREVWVDRGKLCTGRILKDWILHCEKCGAGELFLNNIGHDGNRKGFDLECVDIALSISKLPTIIFGGAFLNKHFSDGLKQGASAVAAANIFHYKEMATKQVKRYLKKNNYDVRDQ